jgi:O-antigen ligase
MNNMITYMIYLWTFINIGRPQDIIIVLQKFAPGVIVAILSLLCYTMSRQSDSKYRKSVRNVVEFKLLMMFFLMLIISTPFGYYPRISIGFLKDFLLKFGLYLYLVIKVINTRERINGLIKTLFFCGLAMGAAAYLNQDSSPRVSIGSSYDPNDLAMLMVTIIPLGIIHLFMQVSVMSKLMFFSGTVFMLFAVVATQSRGGFIGLVVITASFIWIKIERLSRLKRIIPVVALVIAFASFASPAYIDRLTTIFDESTDEGTGQGSGRLLVWKRALVIAAANPILGVGPNAFESAYGDFLDNDKFPADLSRQATGVSKWQTAHNTILLVLVESGIPGLFLFLAINFGCIKNLVRVMKLPSDQNPNIGTMKMWSSALLVSFFGFHTCGMFLSQSYTSLLYVIYLLSGAILRQATGYNDISKS